MLLDRYLPVFDVRDHHQILVKAEAAQAYAAARAMDIMTSPVIRWLFALRTLPARVRRGRPTAKVPKRVSMVDVALGAGWAILAEEAGHEVVLGALTQPWKPVVEFRGLPGPEFQAFDQLGYTKIAWNLAVIPQGPGTTLVLTETRVAATDPGSRRRFGRYWLVFRPFIGLIRRIALTRLKRDLERPM